MKLNSDMAAVVTGAASGLGEATARLLAAQGVKVAILDLQKERGEKIAAEIGGAFFSTDVTNEASVDAALASARAAHGVERLLVNCAGIAPGKRTVAKKRDTGELIAHDIATFHKTIAINLIGTFMMISKCAAAMAGLEAIDADGQRGLIVNTSSVAAEDGQIGQAAYSASKGGVYAMTLPVARDLAQEGIRCNTILPGIMWTPMMAGMDQKIQDALAAAIPFPSRLGTPADYASLVLELARNVYINGECIRLDGAIRLAPR